MAEKGVPRLTTHIANLQHTSFTASNPGNIPGLVTNHNLPIIKGYWILVNKRLQLEKGQNSTMITEKTIPFASPPGLLDGWRISFEFIKTSNDAQNPDPTGFYHALAFWLYGDQDLYATVWRTIYNQTEEQLQIFQGKEPQFPLLYSLLDCGHPKLVQELKDLLYRNIYGKTPQEIAYLSAASLFKAAIVLVRINHHTATWKEYLPVGMNQKTNPPPPIYLLYSDQLNQFQILWNPSFHQPANHLVQTPAKNPSHVSLTLQSPFQPSSKLDSPKNASSNIKKDLTLISIEDLNQINLTYLPYQLLPEHSRCNSTLFPEIKKAHSFDTGNFSQDGWRLTIKYIKNDDYSMWRALSVWKYHNQEMYNQMRSRFQQFHYDLGTIPEDKSQDGIEATLKRVTLAYQVNIVLVSISMVGIEVKNIFPNPINDKEPISITWLLYAHNTHFEILYCRHHLT